MDDLRERNRRLSILTLQPQTVMPARSLARSERRLSMLNSAAADRHACQVTGREAAECESPARKCRDRIREEISPARDGTGRLPFKASRRHPNDRNHTSTPDSWLLNPVP